MTVAQQAQAFAAMALCGALLGLAYELLAALRRGRVLTAAADVLFGGAVTAGITCTALWLRCEAFRLYTLLGVTLGFALYQGTIGTTVRFLKARIGKLSKKVVN